MARLAPSDAPRLKLKSAFGFPGARRSVAQPTIFGGRVFVGSLNGKVYSLNAKSGCTTAIPRSCFLAAGACSDIGRRPLQVDRSWPQCRLPAAGTRKGFCEDFGVIWLTDTVDIRLY
jgi:hypothetical protein